VVNIVLFLLLVVGLSVWFQKHLYLYVKETYLVGGTLTIWGLWKLVKHGFDTATGGKKPETNKILRQPGTTEYLVIGIFVTAVLYLTTSSVYVEYGDAPRGEPAYAVEVLNDGKPIVKTLEVASYQTTAGRPFFLTWGTTPLSFEIAEPAGYLSTKDSLRPGQSIRLRVPDSFPRISYHVLRLVPDRELLNVLPELNGPVATEYALEIRRGGKVFRWSPMRQAAVCIGAGPSKILGLLESESSEKRRAVLEGILGEFNMPSEAWDYWLRFYEHARHILPTDRFAPGDEISVRVLGVVDSSVIVDTLFVVSEREGILTAGLKRGS
jgi:hypothetical protein